jgi:pimeloyl-ACP methyl ester carboxylesterase
VTGRTVQVASTPLAPDARDASIYVRDLGSGRPLVFLHGGWGYSIYPFGRQIAALEPRYRILIPDRSGYGRSQAIAAQPPDFHARAALETFAVLDALELKRAVLWGHSDGAVIALRMALMSPDRVDAVIAEATHYYRRKPGSRLFFETMRDAPDALGERVAATLQAEHGSRWRHLMQINGAAWLQIAADAPTDTADLYDSRLPQLAPPTLLVHGARDPRTEPGELDRLIAAIGHSPRVLLLEQGGHSPHSENATADAVTEAAAAFLANQARDFGSGATVASQRYHDPDVDSARLSDNGITGHVPPARGSRS